ncbi:MAG: ribonuclease III, partial [Rickettsiales bacterium]|nr:ribonuclease III [Rickettsiales bacterium]
MSRVFSRLEEILGYKFADSKLLEEALTHPSVLPGKNGRKVSYERLELLGDSVLLCAVVRYLFESHREETEGELSRRRAILVSSRTLAEIAERMHLGDYMLLGRGEELNGGRRNPNNLENILEAVIGAIFMDSNFEVVQNFILRVWADLDRKIENIPVDPKTELQEWTQKHFRTLPQYELLLSGPEKFHLRLSVP